MVIDITNKLNPNICMSWQNIISRTSPIMYATLSIHAVSLAIHVREIDNSVTLISMMLYN